MRYTHFHTPWDERCSSRAGTLLYGFNQQLTNPMRDKNRLNYHEILVIQN